MSTTPSFSQKAREHWTAERTSKLTGGRNYPITPAEGADLLRALGLLNRDASMSADAVRKYKQINHLVTLVEPWILELCQRFTTVRVLDAGCGSSYLTMLLAWCFRERWRHPAQIIGIDNNPQVIAKCVERAAQVGLESTLAFEATPIAGFDWFAARDRCFGVIAPSPAPAPAATPDESAKPKKPPRPHAVFALHACDTATDHALALGVDIEADFIAVAPCCQAQLAQHWASLSQRHVPGPWAPIWSSPHLRREAAATVTDALRLLYLRSHGYETTAQEFVPSTHTPKNTLLRGVRRGRYLASARDELQALAESAGIDSPAQAGFSLLSASPVGEAKARLEALNPSVGG